MGPTDWMDPMDPMDPTDWMDPMDPTGRTTADPPGTGRPSIERPMISVT